MAVVRWFFLVLLAIYFPFITGTKVEILKKCCGLGNNYAGSGLKCSSFQPPIAGVAKEDEASCLNSVSVCCKKQYREKQCELGQQDARAGKACTSSGDDPDGEFKKDCCEACVLGLETGALEQSCDSGFGLGALMDSAFEACCTKKTTPAPTLSSTTQRPTSKPSRFTKSLDKNDNFGSSLEALCDIPDLCAHICIPSGDSYRCECYEGFTLMADGISCKPSKKSTSSSQRCGTNNPCEQSCTDTGVAIKCSCYEGYELNSDKRTCRDIDECALGLDECEENEVCVNYEGDYDCEVSEDTSLNNVGFDEKCPDGYKFDGARMVCDDIDECEVDLVCPKPGKCINTIGSFKCVDDTPKCPPGFYFKESIQTCDDIDECLLGEDDCNRESQICLNTKGNFTCIDKASKKACPPGFKKNVYTQQCEDINECEEDPLICGDDEECVNEPGGHNCVKTSPKPDSTSSNYPSSPDQPSSSQSKPSSIFPSQPTTSSQSKPSSGITPLHIPSSPSSSFVPSLSSSSQPSSYNPSSQSSPSSYNPPSSPSQPSSSSYNPSSVVPSQPSPSAYSPSSIVPSQSNPSSYNPPSVIPQSSPSYNPPSVIPSQSSPSYSPSGVVPSQSSASSYSPSSYRPQSTVPSQSSPSSYNPASSPSQPSSSSYNPPSAVPSQSSPSSYHPPSSSQTSSSPRQPASQPSFSQSPQYSNYPSASQPSAPSSERPSYYRPPNYQGRPYVPPNQASCSAGLRMSPQTLQCVDIDECSEDKYICDSNQDCYNTVGSYICNCKSGFTKDYQTGACVDINECQIGQHECVEGQRCDNTIGSYQCSRTTGCGTGYTLNSASALCEDDDECALGLHNCHDLGPKFQCRNTLGSYRCERIRCVGDCFFRQQHTTPSNNVLPPRPEPSQSYPIIINQMKKCLPGYIKNANGQCEDINECESNPCSRGEKCINRNGGYQCIIYIQCKSGYELNEAGTECVDINECARGTHKCKSSQICKNGAGFYICQCPPGHKLNTDNECEDINECEFYRERICSRNAECINTIGSYKCHCKEGFREKGLGCEDIDECEETPGLCQQNCVNLWGGYRCSCERGFTLSSDNRTCTDINECEKFKDKHLCVGSCHNTPGSYTCKCPEGYRLGIDGRTCQDVDECQRSVCPNYDDVCVNTRGNFKCHTITCPPHYIKDPEHKSRCKRASNVCDIRDTNCIRMPGQYSYHFVTFVSNLPMPEEGNIDFFQMKGPSWTSSTANFNMNIMNVRCPRTIKQADDSFFRMKRDSHKAVVSLIRSVEGPQEIELQLQMELYVSGVFQGKAVSTVFIFVSEHEF